MTSEEQLWWQSDRWDERLAQLPRMHCGRLDMTTWNAVTGDMQMMVYIDGVAEPVVCEGAYADLVGYAANRYQPLLAQLSRVPALNPRLLAACKSAMQVVTPCGCTCSFTYETEDGRTLCLYEELFSAIAEAEAEA